MIGFTITDKLITFLEYFDTEERPWSTLYNGRYLNKVFTREMADSLSTDWDTIRGNHYLTDRTSRQIIINVSNDVST